MTLARIARYVYGSPWAMEPGYLFIVQQVLMRRFAGEKLSREEIAALIGEKKAENATKLEAAAQVANQAAGQGIAVLGLRGIIAHRIEELQDVSAPPGTSTEVFGRKFDAALADTNVGHIVIDVDSPGGNVEGVEELATKIFKARGIKPITAVANALAASAAYWIASQADELIVTPSGEVGSIGVFGIHEDISAQAEMLGIKVTYIYAGKYKIEGNPFQPLGDEARAAMQARVDEYYDSFVKAVAAGRGVKVSEVRGGFGQGRVVGAKQAVELGMADRVGTLEDTIARIQKSARRKPKSAALAYYEHRFNL